MLDKILFFFSALGVFNALLLTAYLLFTNKYRSTYRTLISLLLFFLVIRVGISCFYFFGPLPSFLIKLGLVANLFLGPTMLSIAFISIKENSKITTSYILQLALLTVGVSLVWLFFDFEVWDYEIRYIIHGILTVYLVWTVFLWKKELVGIFTSKGLLLKEKENIVLFLALLGTCAGFALSLVTTYILGPLVFSVILYSTLAYFFVNRTNQKKSYSKKIQKDKFDSVYKKLVLLMEGEGLHRDPDLNLEQLANRLSVSKHFLSQMLNDNLQKNFYQYVNEFRISEACRFLQEKKPYSIESIGYEVGFRSRSSFFSAFKKLKGMTPAKYKEKYSLS